MRSSAATAVLRDIAHHIDLATHFTHGLRRDTLPRDHLRSLAPLTGRFEGAAPIDYMEGCCWGRQYLSPRLRRRAEQHVWDTVQIDLPPLRIVIQQEVTASRPPPAA
jgi:uncharacterized protein with HEPN domain